MRLPMKSPSKTSEPIKSPVRFTYLHRERRRKEKATIGVSYSFHGLRVWDHSALQMERALFACCRATEQLAQQVPCNTLGIWLQFSLQTPHLVDTVLVINQNNVPQIDLRELLGNDCAVTRHLICLEVYLSIFCFLSICLSRSILYLFVCLSRSICLYF